MQSYMPSVDNATSGYAPVMCDVIDRFIFDLFQGCSPSAALPVGQLPTAGSLAALVRAAICGDATRALFNTARQSRHLRTSSALTAAISTTMKFDNPSVGIVPHCSISPATLIRKLKSGISVLCLLIVGLLPLGASAQITEPLLPLIPGGAVFTAPTAPQTAPTEGESGGYPGETVTSRYRPEFSAAGVRFGNYYWFPIAELDETYNSNIFATTTAPSSDLITTLAPSFALVSISPRAALNLSGSAALQEYAAHPSQNTQTGTFSVNGAYPVSAGGTVSGNAQVSHPYIAYGSPTSPSATTIAEPVTYWNYTASTGYQQSGRRFSYGVNFGVNAAQYNAAPLVGGGVSPQSSQNALIGDAAVNAGYEIAPDYFGFIRVDGSRYDYLRATTAANFTTYRADFGLRIAPRHLIYGNVYAGYLLQNYAQSTGGLSFPDYGGELVWTVTTLTTLTFDAVRNFYTGTPSNGPTTAVSTGPAGNGYLSSTVGARADHELLRNLLLTFNATYEDDTFQGITRTDHVLTAGTGFTYLVNRYFFLGGSFSYYQRNSTVSGVSFSQNILMLRLGTQF
jgi:hypothetical protein